MQSIADASIQRPSVFEELFNKQEEIGFLEKIVVPVAHLPVVLVSGLIDGGCVSKDISLIQCHGSALDLLRTMLDAELIFLAIWLGLQSSLRCV